MSYNKWNTNHTARGRFNEMPFRHRMAAVCAIVGSVVLGIRSSGESQEDFESRLLLPEEVVEVCTSSDLRITFRGAEGRQRYATMQVGADVVDGTDSIIEKYFPATDKLVAHESIITANPQSIPGNNVIQLAISQFDTVTLPVGKSLSELGQEMGFDRDSMECVNGLAGDSRFAEDRAVVVPRQAATPEGHHVVVVKQGDTYVGIAEQYDIDPKYITPEAIKAKNLVPPTNLQPGDLLYIHHGEVVAPNEKLQEFVRQYEPYARAVEDEYGIPYEAVLAQAVLESGYGESSLAREANNFHGLKYNDEPYVVGEPYIKVTTEEVSEADLSGYGDRIVSKKMLGNGNWLIEIEDSFQSFIDEKSGFMGYGEHIYNRYEGSAYGDAIGIQDPYEYVTALVDDEGARYATDSTYVSKVHRIIDQIREYKQPTPRYNYNPESSADIRALWDTYEDFERPMTVRNDACNNPVTGEDLILRSEFERFEISYKNFEKVELTKDKYERFVGSGIIDSTTAVAQVNPRAYNHPDFGGQPGLNDPDSVRKKVDHFLIHFTANPQSADQYDGEMFSAAMRNGNPGALVQFLINRTIEDDSQTYYLTPHFTYQLNDLSSRVMGVEIAGCTQAALLPVQLENALYLSAMFLEKYGYATQGDSIEEVVNQVIKGSYEPVIGRPGAHTDGAPVIMDPFRQKLISFMVDELGYQR